MQCAVGLEGKPGGGQPAAIHIVPQKLVNFSSFD